jgi:hypothetical protein
MVMRLCWSQPSVDDFHMGSETSGYQTVQTPLDKGVSSYLLSQSACISPLEAPVLEYSAVFTSLLVD